MLWVLLFVVPKCLALICFTCGDYMGARTICSQGKTCTGTRCLLAHLKNATNFVADCYTGSTSADDFCWTDSTNRTLCACKSLMCNSAANTARLKSSETNLIPDVKIDTLLTAFQSTTVATTSHSVTSLPGTTPFIAYSVVTAFPNFLTSRNMLSTTAHPTSNGVMTGNTLNTQSTLKPTVPYQSTLTTAHPIISTSLSLSTLPSQTTVSINTTVLARDPSVTTSQAITTTAPVTTTFVQTTTKSVSLHCIPILFISTTLLLF